MTELILSLHELAHGGVAVGRHEGRPIFVPLGIPGERVRVELVEERSRHARARLVEVLDPAPERVAPPCPYFGLCGGCHLQHIDYAAQLRFKREIVLAQLQRIGQQAQPLVRPMLGMAAPWAYRNHVQLMLAGASGEPAQLGYQALRSHAVVPVEECLITHPLLDELWAVLDLQAEGLERVSLRAGTATEEQMIIFEGDDQAIPALEVAMPVSCVYQCRDGGIIVMAGDSCYHERLAGHLFRVSAPSFFQVNTEQAERLVAAVGQYLALRPDETLLDAYCGVGTFAHTLASQGARVVGIEESPWAIADACSSADDQHFQSAGHLAFMAGRVEDVLRTRRDTYQAVVLDPPRAGCSPQALEALARCGAERIAYVSCDPATLARDVARFSTLGYALVEVQPVDMFPQTYHIECVALLQSSRSRRIHSPMLQ